MPRAPRFYLPGEVWHITQRYHQQAFLLKFERDRLRWRYWLYQAKKRYGLSVLNYICTSNHIHLLVRDTGKQAIAKSMQLISGGIAQEFNKRKSRRGAFWLLLRIPAFAALERSCSSGRSLPCCGD